VRSGDFGPRPPGSPSFPYDPNRTSWTATSNGITLKLTIDRQGAAVGQPVTFTLEATHGTEACCGLYLLFGDGAKFDQQAAEPCGGSKGSPGTKTATTTHPYNGDGLWEFSFQAYTGNCNTDYHSYGSFYGWVNITPGAPTANGPAVPKMEGGWGGRPSGHESDQMWVTVAGHGMDEDGYVHHFSVDWGDGSPLDTSPGDPMGCRPTSGGWPATSHAWMPPNGSPSPPPTHQYAAPGDYAITVTVHSIGCNGTDEQLGLLKMTWHTNGYNP
jgi:hypothetical protein